MYYNCHAAAAAPAAARAEAAAQRKAARLLKVMQCDVM